MSSSSLFQVLFVVTMGLLAADARAAEPPSVEQRAREDLDRQLREMVRTPAPEVVISYEGLPGASGSRGYKLVEAEFLLDGQPLTVPGTELLSSLGLHKLAAINPIAEGPHTLVSRVTYASDSWSLFSEESGFLWKMTASVTFQAQRGLRTKVRVVPGINPTAPDPRLKLKLTHDVGAEMTAPLADVSDAAPDAGAPVKPEPPKVVVQTPTVPVKVEPTPKPPVVAEAPQQGPEAPARVLLKVTAAKRPVAATVFLRGKGATQRVQLERTAKNPTPVVLPAGPYTVEVLAQGFLAQARRVEVSREKELTLAFTLARAPRKGQQPKVKNERVELPRAPRFSERQTAPRKGSASGMALLVDVLVRDANARIRIEGHTDSREGTPQTRQQLSEARARAVADLLLQGGVDPSRVETAGFSDKRPKAPNMLPRGRELNRRVEFVLLHP